MSDDVLNIGNVIFNKSAVAKYEQRTVPAEYFGKDGVWTDTPVKKMVCYFETRFSTYIS